jgi:GntR family transcriptional regulator, rspAB operon transcriptional repressor
MAQLLSEKIYESVRLDIFKGVYKPGDQLSVKKLADQYGVSASPIRDALTALKQDGLVEIHSRMGCFVSRVTLREIKESYELRIILEGASAEMAAQRITEKELEYLESLPYTYIPGDLSSYLAYLVANREFHYRVALASGNTQLADLISSLLYKMQRQVFLGIGSGSYNDEIFDAHPNLIEALKRRDSAEARRVMVLGIEHARAATLAQIISQGDLAVTPPEFSV